MKDHKILTALFLSSLAAYAALLLVTGIGTFYPYPLWFYWLQPRLLLSFHAVPFFCLQLLLCRAARRRVWTAVPCVLVILAAAGCTLGFATAKGWDALGWGVLLLGCIAPAVGCVLAWVVHALQSWSNHRSHSGNV